MSSSSASLAIVVVSYNTRDMLRVCLSTLYAALSQAELKAEVWVVDNASSDGSPSLVRAMFPQTQLLALKQNLGFASANNIALRELGLGKASRRQPENIFFLNPDTEIEWIALLEMLRALRSRDRAGVVGAALVYPDGRFQHSAFRFPTLWQVWFDFFAWPARLLDSSLNGRYPPALYASDQPFAIDHPLGAAMLIRSEVVRQVGLMDDAFFMYAEEIDWCIRIKRAGWGIYCAPAAQIVHHSGGSTRQFRDEMFVALWRSRFRLFHKHYGRVFNLAVRGLVRLGLWAEMRRARRRYAGQDLRRRLGAYHQVWELTAE